MRSSAKICKISLLIACNISIFQIGNQIKLILIILKHLQCFFLGNLLTDNLKTSLCNLLHFLLDCSQVLFLKYVITKINIIVESFCNNWSYPEFCLWIQMLDRLCHHMGTGMVKCLQLFVFFKVYHFDLLLFLFILFSIGDRAGYRNIKV